MMKTIFFASCVIFAAFSMSCNPALAQEVQDPEIVQADVKSPTADSQQDVSAPEPKADEKPVKKARPGNTGRVLFGLLSFGALIASTLTSVPVDSLKMIAVSVASDQAAK